MSILEMQVDALMRLCTAEKESDRVQVREEVRKMLENRKAGRAIADPEYLIRDLLLEIGAPDHLVGHPYVIRAILLVMQDRLYINSITEYYSDNEIIYKLERTYNYGKSNCYHSDGK